MNQPKKLFIQHFCYVCGFSSALLQLLLILNQILDQKVLLINFPFNLSFSVSYGFLTVNVL